MYRKFFVTACGVLLLLLCVNGPAFGHRFTLSQINGQLVLETQGVARQDRVGYVPTFDPNTNQPIINDSGNPRSFVEEFDRSGLLEQGGFGLISDAHDELDLTDSYRMEFAGPLWYSKGGAATLSSAIINVQSYTSANLQLDTHLLSGNTNQGTLIVIPHSFHPILWALDAGAADGVYGFAYRVLWDDAGAPTQFKASNWVHLLAVTRNFADSPNLLAAEQSVLAASVPEPSTLALAALGAWGLLIAARRRR